MVAGTKMPRSAVKAAVKGAKTAAKGAEKTYNAALRGAKKAGQKAPKALDDGLWAAAGVGAATYRKAEGVAKKAKAKVKASVRSKRDR